MAAPTTAQTPFRAKRRERPLQSPQATPSPQAKGVRLTEPHAQASQEQPATTSNIQQPATKQRKESESKEENIGKGVKRSEWKRVHKLSQEIRAIGGKLINEDKENRHKQTRLPSPEHCGEVLQFSFNAGVHDGCGLFLVKWYKDKETKCQVCGQITKRGELPYDSIKSWSCLDHDFRVCTRCLPVVLDTPEE